MAVIIPNEAERNILGYVRQHALITYTATIKLFQGGGAVTIDATTTVATLDAEEADYSGYSAITRTDWTTAATDGAGNAYTQCSSVNFQHDGGGTANDIYGWYMVSDGSELICCEEFSSPVTMDDVSDIINFTPKIFARQGP